MARHIKPRTSPAVRVRTAKPTTGTLRTFGIDGLVLLFHQPQFFVPRSSALDALHGELAAQSRRGICRPYDLAHGFIAAALHHHEVSDVGWRGMNQLSCEQAVRWRRFGFAGQEIPLPSASTEVKLPVHVPVGNVRPYSR